MHPSADTGRVIAGRYRLQAPIGRGAMGVVWRARDQLLDRDVAIKEVQIADTLTEEERATAFQRTLREAKTAARLNHPAVVTVYDVAEDGGRPWIVMQLVHAQSLDQMLAASGPLSPRRAAEMARQLLSALSVAHAAGVMHRDVKPSNVLLGSDDRAVLTDFGIATFADDPKLTQTGMVMGSPGFTAPERIRGEDASPASDLWSLGATIYAAVEGHGPFEKRGGAITTMSAIINEDAPEAPTAGALGPVIAALLRREPVGPAGRQRGRADDRRRAAAAGRPRTRRRRPATRPPRCRRRRSRPRPGQDRHRRFGAAGSVAPPGSASPGSPRGGPAADAAAGRERAGLRADGGEAARLFGRVHRPARTASRRRRRRPPRPRRSRRSLRYRRSRRRRRRANRSVTDRRRAAGRAPGTALAGSAESWGSGRVRGPAGRAAARFLLLVQPGPQVRRVVAARFRFRLPATGGLRPGGAGRARRRSRHGPPPWSGAEYAPSRPRRSGFGWKAAVVALAIIGAAAGAGTVVLLHQGHSGSPQGQTTGTGSASGSASGSSSASLPPSTLQIIDAINKPATGPLPSGFTMTSQPAASNETAGFTIAAPTNWQKSTSGYQTYLTDPTDPNTNILIDLTPHTYPDMLREAQYIESQSIPHFPGYKRVGMAATNVRGTTGSWWKFTWNKKGVQQEALDLLFVVHTSAGPQSYALYVTAPESKFDQMRPIFDEEVETFATLPS